MVRSARCGGLRDRLAGLGRGWSRRMRTYRLASLGSRCCSLTLRPQQFATDVRSVPRCTLDARCSDPKNTRERTSLVGVQGLLTVEFSVQRGDIDLEPTVVEEALICVPLIIHGLQELSAEVGHDLLCIMCTVHRQAQITLCTGCTS